MTTPNDLADHLEHFLERIRSETLTMSEGYQSGRELIAAAKGASAQQLDDVVAQLAALISSIGLARAGLVALLCGALVEEGASITPMAQPTLARYGEALQGAIPFIEACDTEVASGALASDGDLSQLGREEFVMRIAPRVSQSMSGGMSALMALKTLNTAALAVLSRSKALRRQTQADTAFKRAVARLQELGFEQTCLPEMLSLLDDEEIVVLHPQLARGYDIRIAGIGNNFQLHTLLEGALIGDVAQGWLPGERPSREVLALSTDAPITDPNNLPTVVGAMNLWNWTGLRADASLAEGLHGSHDHWIWNEGLPADIVPYRGTRVILLGQPPYRRSWFAGRYFPAMVGELEVLRQMPEDEARAWLNTLARAPKPMAPGHSVTAADVERLNASH